ncbi:glycosyltransferase family 2 protein [Alteromonas aestuariivivens]|nr:glycosyltransferase family 2 protein [Alteromonas aestuariivivens]
MPDPKPVFSIIMPAYNRASLIESVTSAIFNQSYSDFELIVVDDGSTDNTLEILDSIKDKRLRVIAKANSRQTQSRRIACEHAKGQYLAFCDSDDLWHQDYLQTLLDVFEHQQAEYVFTNYIVTGEGRPRIDTSKDLVQQWLADNSNLVSDSVYHFDDLYLALLDYQPIFTSCQALTAEHYRKIGGISEGINNIERNTVLTSEDSHIIRRSALTRQAYFVDRTLVTLGRQGDNMSHSFVSNLRGGRFILEDILSNTKLSQQQYDKTKAEIASHTRQIALQLYYQEDRKSFINFYKSSKKAELSWKSHLHFVRALWRNVVSVG